MMCTVPATLEHVAHVIANLRDDDRHEVMMLGIPPAVALTMCIQGSVEAWTALEDDKPIACWGLMADNLIGGVGYPWMLTTHRVEHHKVQLVRDSRIWVAKMLNSYPRLEAIVDCRYTRALRWLRRMGFTILSATPACKAHIEAPKWA
jgi:hypothetical protein